MAKMVRVQFADSLDVAINGSIHEFGTAARRRRAEKIYHYLVTSEQAALIEDAKLRHVVVRVGDEFKIARILRDEVLEADDHATKPIVQVVDDRDYKARLEAEKERQRIIKELRRLRHDQDETTELDTKAAQAKVEILERAVAFLQEADAAYKARRGR